MCAVDTLSPVQKEALGFLESLGLVHRRKPTSRRFYPTSLGASSVFGQPTSQAEEQRRQQQLEEEGQEAAKEQAARAGAGPGAQESKKQ